MEYGEIASVRIEHNGVERTVREWADVLGVPYPTVRMRYKRGKREFVDLFRTCPGATSIRYEEAKQRVTYQKKTFLDDMFPADTVAKLRHIAKETNHTPIEVMVKIVQKRVDELLDTSQNA